MYAIQVDDGALAWREVPTPRPGPGEVAIRVEATAVNRADLLQATGRYPPPPGASDVLGLECAGVVDEVGPGVTTWREGDEVCALLAGGGYAQRVVCPAGQVAPKPAGLGWTEAAAIPEVFATAWLNLRVEAALVAGERVVVHAGASGVGTAAVQLCRVWGAPVWVTAGSPEKVARCVALGAEGGHDRHAGPWTEAPWAREGLDVALDPVGGAYLADHLRVLRTGGRLVVIGLMGGRKAELDLAALMTKRLRLVGSVLRARSVLEKTAIVAGLVREVWPTIVSGDVHPVISSVLGVQEAGVAHSLVASDATVGKVVLVVPH